MKKLFYLPLMLGAIAVAFTSCREEADPTIHVDRTALEFSYGAGSQTFTLTASDTWTATGSGLATAEGSYISPPAGADATAGLVVRFYVAENPTHIAREGLLRLTLAGGEFVDIRLFQEGNPTGIPDIAGPWTVTWWEEFEEDVVRQTDPDTIFRNRNDARLFHVFGFLGEPRPVIQWDGTNWIYITGQLPNSPYWQAPFVVVDEGPERGEIFSIPDTVARLLHSQNRLNGGDAINLLIPNVGTYPAYLLFTVLNANPNASDFNFGASAIDVVEAPVFTRGGALAPPRRVIGDINANAITIEVSLDDRVGNIRDIQPRSRR